MTEQPQELREFHIGLKEVHPLAESPIAKLFKWRAGLSKLASLVLGRLSTVQRILIEGAMTSGKSTLAGLFSLTGRVILSADASVFIMRRAIAVYLGVSLAEALKETGYQHVDAELHRSLIRGFKYPCVIEGWNMHIDMGMIAANDAHLLVIIRPVDALVKEIMLSREHVKQDSDPKKFALDHVVSVYKSMKSLTHSSVYGKYASFWYRQDGLYHLIAQEEAEKFTQDPTDALFLGTITGAPELPSK